MHKKETDLVSVEQLKDWPVKSTEEYGAEKLLYISRVAFHMLAEFLASPDNQPHALKLYFVVTKVAPAKGIFTLP